MSCESQGVTGPGNGPSVRPSLSESGDVLVFTSRATNLDAACAVDGQNYVFAKVVGVGAPSCVTPSANAASGAAVVSGDGWFVVFSSGATNLLPPASLSLARGSRRAGPVAQASGEDIFRWDRVRGQMDQLMEGAGQSTNPAVSRDGLLVVFESAAPGLTPDDPESGSDIFAARIVPVPADRSRPVLVAPANGTQVSLEAPVTLTIRWTAVDGAVDYGLEHTGPNLGFTGPTVPDPVNGFGGAGGGVLVRSQTSLSVPLGPGVPAGTYQVRVIGVRVGPGGEFQGFVGEASEPLTVHLGPVVIPPNPRPRITEPVSGVMLARGASARIAWTLIPGVSEYFVEVKGPDQPFSNPNGTGPDPTALAEFVVPQTSIQAQVPLDLPAGAYRVRVMARTRAGARVGTWSDDVLIQVLP